MDDRKCNSTDCPYTKDEADEELVTNTILCDDPVCSNVHQKKIVGMNEGITQLEKILKNMTGLCKGPIKPSKENIPLLKQDGEACEKPCDPCPAVVIDFTKEMHELTMHLPPIAKRQPANKVPFDAKICQGPVCCNKYMGYKMENLNKTCDSQTCFSKPKTPNKPCGKPTCLFSQKSPFSSGWKSNLIPELDKPKSGGGPCGGVTCPYPTSDLFPSTYKSPLDNLFSNSSKQPYNYDTKFNNTYAEPCNINTCPLANNIQDQSGVVPVGLCGRRSCPFASVENAQKLALNTDDYPTSGAPCGNASCPYQDTGMQKNKTCGDPSCPFSSRTDMTNQFSSPCGNNSCPYKQQQQQQQPYQYQYNQIGPCGGYECPMTSQTSPGGIKPCPFANTVKRYPCGSPSCPFVNPSGMLHTHEYGTDLSYIREAARPYCGSASPYDYLSSMDKTYATPYTVNYPLFTKTKPPPEQTPCPYLSKKKKKKTCGQPTCPYVTDEEENNDNFCTDSTCEMNKRSTRAGSMDKSEIRHCQSPDCKVPFEHKHKERRHSGKSNASTRSIFSQLSEEDYHTYKADQMSIVTDTTVRLVEYPENGHPHLTHEENHKCSEKTCPYIRKLVFCEDCGGVLPDEEISDSSLSETNGDEQSFEVIDSEEMEAEEDENMYMSEKEEFIPNEQQENNQIKEENVVVVNEEEIIEKEVVEVQEKTISIYSYPGTQLGHKNCSFSRKLVPGNMGWLWSCHPAIGKPERWRGYRPGAISKGVFKIMKQHRKFLGLIDPTENMKKKKNKSRTKMEDLKHCIEVKKKDGDFTIIVNPVKDPKTRDPLGNPYMDVTPMQFKVEKEKKEPNVCPCDDDDEENASENESQFEFHFTPPAAIPEVIPRKHKNMAEIETQYDMYDLPPELRVGMAKSGKSGGKKKKGKKGKK